MALDKSEKEILEQISNKINSSKVLNGEFDKLVVTVDHIKEKQDQTSEKIDTITNALYEPMVGLFSRVQSIEHSTKTMADDLDSRRSEIKALAAKTDKEQETLDETSDLSRRLKKIAGSELEELTRIIDFKKNATKIYWSMVGLILISVAKLLWELVTTRH